VTVEADLFAALGPLVSDRVYPLAFPLIPPVPAWPGIRYSFISETPFPGLCGDTGDEGSDVRVQVDLVDTTFVSMRALRLSVMSAMSAFDPPTICENTFDTFDAETKTWRCTFDFIVYKSVQLTPETI
jgi:hypothetical protein